MDGGTLRLDDEVELERRAGSGDGYEASQLYIGHMNRLRTAGKHVEAEAVGARGAGVLVSSGHPSLATPLALKVVESMATRKVVVNEATVAQLASLLRAFEVAPASGEAAAGGDAAAKAKAKAKALAKATLTEKMAVSKAACKLAGVPRPSGAGAGAGAGTGADGAAGTAATAAGVAALHAARARDLASLGQLADAAKHFAYADAHHEYADLIKRCVQRRAQRGAQRVRIRGSCALGASAQYPQRQHVARNRALSSSSLPRQRPLT